MKPVFVDGSRENGRAVEADPTLRDTAHERDAAGPEFFGRADLVAILR